MKSRFVLTVLALASFASIDAAKAGPSGDLLKRAAIAAQNDSRISLKTFTESSRISEELKERTEPKRITIDLNEQAPIVDGFALNEIK